MTIGIYQIKNKVNGKIYIGQSIHIENRWKQHLGLLEKYKTDSIHLQHAWDKYGQENFEFSIIEKVNDKNILNEREIYWIKKFKSNERKFGYNISGGGGNIIVSEETRKKMSCSLKGKMAGSKHHMFGKHHSLETREKIRQSQIGKKLSEEHKSKIGEKSKLLKHTEETKRRISNSNKGHIKSDETKRKISESKKGKDSWNKGKQASLEARQKMSEAQKKKTHYFRKIQLDQYPDIINKLKNGISVKAVAKEYGVTEKAIYDIRRKARTN